jgi:thiamine biosynthesis lipoprotein
MKKSTVKFLFLVMCFPLFLSSCENNESFHSSFLSMDTAISFQIEGKNSKKAGKEAQILVQELERLLSKTMPDSDIAKLNAQRELPLKDLSPHTVTLLQLSQKIAQESGGIFDPTLGQLTSLWDFQSDSPVPPSEKAIASALSKSGSQFLSIDSERISLKGEALLDLGGIAKGYIAQQTVEYLKENEVSSALLSFGGNICAIGSKGDRPWRIGVADPQDPSSYIGYLDLQDTCAVTSGSYQRYFTFNGVRYHHILNPQTGYPADSDIQSVTVVYPDSTVADALSTALFILGPEQAGTLLGQYPNAMVIFLTEDHRILCSSELKKLFTPKSSDYSLEYINF